jgi:hypothetical protein
MKTIIQQIKFIVVAVALAAGVSYASTWTAPLSSPPTCVSGNPGCDAPINVGSLAQTKLGSLVVNGISSSTYPTGLQVWGLSQFEGPVQIIDGSQAAGSVLSSDANGDAKWIATSSLGLGGSASANNMESGTVPLACGSYGDSGSGVFASNGHSTSFRFPTAFSSTPRVVITSNWTNYSGDEAPSWWLTNVTSTGFTLNVHTTSDNNCVGTTGVEYVATTN